jgi:hypothetical protein
MTIRLPLSHSRSHGYAELEEGLNTYEPASAGFLRNQPAIHLRATLRTCFSRFPEKSARNSFAGNLTNLLQQVS